ncbi:tyrosine-type recombinase/integrase [Halogeometricum borinquense]|uniref:tyrosine-type recombinase/integrase n=1 Tax=Halogeometricum borinquense TaxID=60847 RepID=UPI00343AFF3F
MTSKQKLIENLRERIKTSEEISDEDREALITFSNKLYRKTGDYTDDRHEKLLRHLTRMAEIIGDVHKIPECEEATNDLLDWIPDTYDNEYTRHDYRIALRVFGGHMTEGPLKDKPPHIAEISTGTGSSHNPIPKRSDMLSWEKDVLPMIDAAQNSRDKALFAVAFDSGARSGELQHLRYGDVHDHPHGLQIFVDGKKGEREILLIPSIPYLNRWLDDHPGKGDETAPLWCKKNTPEAISTTRFLDIFKESAKRAGVTKPVTPTNFRKSNASWLATRGMNEAFINDRQGRSRKSKATRHYVAKFGGEGDDTYAKLHGLEVEDDEEDELGPLVCSRCNRETPRHEDFCMWCHKAMSPKAVETLEEQENKVRKEFLKMARSDPEALDEIERVQHMMKVLDSNPELQEEATRFVEATSQSD